MFHAVKSPHQCMNAEAIQGDTSSWTTICTVHTRIHLSNADVWVPAHQYIRTHKSISNRLPGQHRVLILALGARRSHLELAARCKSCFFNTVSCLVVTALESALAMCGWPFVMGLQSMSASSAEVSLKNTTKSLQKRCAVIVTPLFPPSSFAALRGRAGGTDCDAELPTVLPMV